MIPHRDEILRPAVSTDATAVPRYNLVRPDGTIIEKNVAIRLANPVAREGTPISKEALDEMLAASGVTAGAATAYTLAQEEYTLFDGAEVRFRLHTASGSGATLNVNGTGAKPLRDAMGESMASGMPAGTWLKAIYSAATGAYTVSGGATNVTPADIGAVSDIWYWGKTEQERHDIIVATPKYGSKIITANTWDTNVWGNETHKPPTGNKMWNVLLMYTEGVNSQLWVGDNEIWKTFWNDNGTWSEWQQLATTDYALNKAGDEMAGKLSFSAANGALGAATDDSTLRIDGGTNYDKGAYLTLYGINSWQPGHFELTAGGSSPKKLWGRGDGHLSWDGHVIIHSGNIGNYASGGDAKILSNMRLSSESATVTINLPTEYNYIRVVLSELATTDSSMGRCRGAFNVDTITSGVEVGALGEDGAAAIVSKSSSDYVFDMLIYDNRTYGSVVLDIVRYPDDGVTQGACEWATDGGGNDMAVTMGKSNFSAGGTVTRLTLSVMGGYSIKSKVGILVMGVK